MPKKIWHELPCGAMYRFLEHRYDDITPVDLIRSSFPKEEILKLTNPDSVGRKPKMVAERLNAVIIRAFWSKVISRLMESEVLQINPYTSMYVGVTDIRGSGRAVKHRKKKMAYLRQSKIYGIVLNGFFHEYYFLMPYRRRKELFERLKKGQNFIS